MRKLAFCFCLTALCSFTVLAQTRGQLSKNFLKGKHIIHTHPNPSVFKAKGNIPAPHGFPAGVDTITNFTGHFQAARSVRFAVHERTTVSECGIHQQPGSDADNGR